MKIIKFNSHKEFVRDVIRHYEKLLPNESVCVVAKFFDMHEIIRELCKEGLCITAMDFSDPSLDSYYEEYILCILDGGIFCEPLKSNGLYKGNTSEITYFFDDCNSKVMQFCHSSKGAYEVEVNPTDSIDDTADPDESDMHGFTVTKSDGDKYSYWSFYTSESLSPKDMQGIMQEFSF